MPKITTFFFYCAVSGPHNNFSTSTQRAKTYILPRAYDTKLHGPEAYYTRNTIKEFEMNSSRHSPHLIFSSHYHETYKTREYT